MLAWVGVWWFLAGLVGGCGVGFGGVGWFFRSFGGDLIGWLYMLGLCPKPRFFSSFLIGEVG